MSIDPSSLNRITGLASGMDTDSLVKKLMSGEQTQIDQLKQKQQKDLWLSDAYRQWNTDLASFQTNTLLNMKLSGTYNTFNVSPSDPNSVSGSAGGGAVAGTYNIAVKQLAQSATLTGNKVALVPSQPLGVNTSFSITVNNDPAKSATISVTSNETINDVITSINSATDGSSKSLGLQAIYDKNLQQFIIKTKDTGANTNIQLSSNSFLSNTLGLGTKAAVTTDSSINLSSSLTYNIGLDSSGTSVPITVSSASSLQDLVNKINTQISTTSLATNVTASIVNGNLTFTSAKTGTSSYISVSGPGFSASPATSNGSETLTAQGQNADIIFNGNEINTLSSNNATIMGINWTFKTTTSLDANGNSTTNTVNVSQDIDTEVKNIKDFISKYNDILDKLNTAYSEPVYKDYQPLTDVQRSSMSDSQIQQWETKAKSGLLHSDSILNTLTNNMRNDMTSVVNNGSTYNSLAAIGISSSSYMDKGKLYVDDTKLRTAIQNDPDAVRNLFSNLDSTNYSKNGLMNKLGNDMTQAITSLTDKAGSTGNSQYDQSTIGKLLTSIQTQISTKTDSFNTKENQYYTQFSAMEQAMQKYTSQSSWLTSQLGASSGA